MIFLTLLATLVGDSNGNLKGHCFSDGDRISLKGRVSKQWFAGPPNFGETPKRDKKIRVPVLTLQSPILPCEEPEFDNADGSGKIEPVLRLQLDRKFLRFRGGALISVTGKIRHSQHGGDFLDYVLESLK